MSYTLEDVWELGKQEWKHSKQSISKYKMSLHMAGVNDAHEGETGTREADRGQINKDLYNI